MTVIAAVLVLSSSFEYYKLKTEARNHWVALVFVVTIYSYFLFCLFTMAGYIQECKDGNMENALMGVGVFFQALHEAFFILHILLLCKGWGLFRHKINIKERMIIGCYFMSYLILIMNSVYWKYFRSEIEDDQNFYKTSPGIIYLTVRLLSFFLIHRNLYHSVPNDSLIDNKFILVVYIAGIIYIFAPCIGCLISLGVKDYEKYYVVDISNTVISAFIYLILLIFYYPSRITKMICPNYFASDPLNPAYQQNYMKDDVTGKIEHGFSVLLELQSKLLELQKQCIGFNCMIEKTVHELGLDPNTYISHGNSNPIATLQYARHEEIKKRSRIGGGGRRRGNNNDSNSSSFNSDKHILLPKSGNKMVLNNDVAGSMRGPKDDDDDDDEEEIVYDNNNNHSHHSHHNKDINSDDDYNNNINNGRISHGAPNNKDPFEYSNNNSHNKNRNRSTSNNRNNSEITTPLSNRHNSRINNNITPSSSHGYNSRNELNEEDVNLRNNKMGRDESRHNDIIPRDNIPPIDPSTRRSRDNYGNTNNYYENNFNDFNQSPSKRNGRESGSSKHKRVAGRMEQQQQQSISQTSNRSSQPRRLEPISRHSSNENGSVSRLERIGGSNNNRNNIVDPINLGGRRTPLHNENKTNSDEDDYDHENNPLLDALY